MFLTAISSDFLDYVPLENVKSISVVTHDLSLAICIDIENNDGEKDCATLEFNETLARQLGMKLSHMLCHPSMALHEFIRTRTTESGLKQAIFRHAVPGDLKIPIVGKVSDLKKTDRFPNT